MFYTPTEPLPKVSRITRRDDGAYQWTVNGVYYHTDTRGEGIWRGDDWTRQITGTCQFSANGSNRRSHLLFWLLRGTAEYEEWCNDENLTPGPTSAARFFSEYSNTEDK